MEKLTIQELHNLLQKGNFAVLTVHDLMKYRQNLIKAAKTDKGDVTALLKGANDDFSNILNVEIFGEDGQRTVVYLKPLNPILIKGEEEDKTNKKKSPFFLKKKKKDEEKSDDEKGEEEVNDTDNDNSADDNNEDNGNENEGSEDSGEEEKSNEEPSQEDIDKVLEFIQNHFDENQDKMEGEDFEDGDDLNDAKTQKILKILSEQGKIEVEEGPKGLNVTGIKNSGEDTDADDADTKKDEGDEDSENMGVNKDIEANNKKRNEGSKPSLPKDKANGEGDDYDYGGENGGNNSGGDDQEGGDYSDEELAAFAKITSSEELEKFLQSSDDDKLKQFAQKELASRKGSEGSGNGNDEGGSGDETNANDGDGVEKTADKDKDKDKDIYITSKRFVPPTLDEVMAYCQERKNDVDANRFFEYFTAGGWKDSKGNAVKNWKQKIITWEKHNAITTGAIKPDKDPNRWGNLGGVICE